MSNVHIANKVFSKQVQSDSSLVMVIPSFLDDYKLSLQKLCSSLGPESNRRLPLLNEGEIAMPDFKKPDRVLVFKDDDQLEQSVDALSLVSATGDITIRLLAYQKNFVEALLANFDERLKIPRVAVLLRTIFEFRRMPLQNTATSHEKLLVWGDTELGEMCSTYFPELDPAIAKDEALAMRIYVRENQELFMQPKDPMDVSKGLVLALKGAGSVFETLSKRSDVCSKPIPNILKNIADYMIAFM